jgi:hypothetical protein
MNRGAWSLQEDDQLRTLARSGLSLRAIANDIGRGLSSVRDRSVKLNIVIALDRNPMKSPPRKQSPIKTLDPLIAQPLRAAPRKKRAKSKG